MSAFLITDDAILYFHCVYFASQSNELRQDGHPEMKITWINKSHTIIVKDLSVHSYVENTNKNMNIVRIFCKASPIMSIFNADLCSVYSFIYIFFHPDILRLHVFCARKDY